MREAIFTHYNGLGDFIICNGLVNTLSEIIGKIHLPIPQCYQESLNFLYSENTNIILFNSDSNPNNPELQQYGKQHNLSIIDNIWAKPFNRPTFQTDLYDALNIPYSARYHNFHLPNNINAIKLFDNFSQSDYVFVHDAFRWQPQMLNINTNKVVVKPNPEITNNIFDYVEIIKNAKEIHCVDSCFYHLVENLQIQVPKYFHDIRNTIGDKMPPSKNWTKINYH